MANFRKPSSTSFFCSFCSSHWTRLKKGFDNKWCTFRCYNFSYHSMAMDSSCWRETAYKKSLHQFTQCDWKNSRRNDRSVVWKNNSYRWPYKNEECKYVGLNLSGDSAEYPCWMLFGSPESEVRIEWFEEGTPSERYIDPNFEACAVICHKCPKEWAEFQGLPIHSEWGRYRLYMRWSIFIFRIQAGKIIYAFFRDACVTIQRLQNLTCKSVCHRWI